MKVQCGAIATTGCGRIVKLQLCTTVFLQRWVNMPIGEHTAYLCNVLLTLLKGHRWTRALRMCSTGVPQGLTCPSLGSRSCQWWLPQTDSETANRVSYRYTDTQLIIIHYENHIRFFQYGASPQCFNCSVYTQCRLREYTHIMGVISLV